MQMLGAERHVGEDAIDVKRGSGMNPQMAAALHVLLHALQINMVIQFVIETRQVQTQLASVLKQMLVFQMMLMRNKQFIHRPEPALRRCRFSRLSGQLSVRVHLPQREVAKNKAHLRAKMRKR